MIGTRLTHGLESTSLASVLAVWTHPFYMEQVKVGHTVFLFGENAAGIRHANPESNILDWQYTGLEWEVAATDDPQEGDVFQQYTQ